MLIGLRKKNINAISGFLASSLLGILGLYTIISIPNDQHLATISLFVIPFIVGYFLTRSPLNSLTLVLISELMFGGSGKWLNLGPISGRWMIFAVLLLVTGFSFVHRELRNLKKRLSTVRVSDALIIFYGVIFPVLLMCYSVIFQGTSIIKALGDVTTYLTLIIYFPLHKLIFENFDELLGWIIGGVVVVAGLSIIMCIVPPDVTQKMFLNLTMGEIELKTAVGSLQRAPAITMLVLPLGIFVGVFYAADQSKKLNLRLMGLVLMFFSFIPFVLNFLRGSLMFLFLTFLLFFFTNFLNISLRSMRWRSFGLMLLLAFSATLAIYFYIPTGVAKFAVDDGRIASWIDPVREEQFKVMIQAWLEEPFLGKGVGVAIKGYSRYAWFEGGSIIFELSYIAILYRIGLIAMIVLVIPIIGFFFELIRMRKTELGGYLSRAEGKLMIAALLTLLTTLLAGFFNPYIYTPFTSFFIVLYLSCRELTAQKSKYQ